MPRSPQAREQLAGADHRLHPVLELGDDELVQLLDQLRRAARLAEPPLEDAAGDLGRGADQLALVGRGELEAAALEQVLLGPRPDRLGVEQEAVVVEDDGVGEGRSAWRGSSRLAPRTTASVARWPSTSRSRHRHAATPGSSTSAREELMATVARAVARGPHDRARRPRVGAEREQLRILEGPRAGRPRISPSARAGRTPSARRGRDPARSSPRRADAPSAPGRRSSIETRLGVAGRATSSPATAGATRAVDWAEARRAARRPRPGGRGRDPRRQRGG